MLPEAPAGLEPPAKPPAWSAHEPSPEPAGAYGHGRPAPPSTEPRAHRNPWPLFAVAVPLALALVAAALWLGLVQWDMRAVRLEDRVQVAERQASAAAERAAVTALSYQHDTLDADLDAATRLMTREFGEEFEDTFETFVRPNAPEQRATVTAKVLATAVVTADEDRAEILVYVDQTTLNTVHREPSVALNRTTFDMVRRGGRWLVAGFHSY